MATKITYLDADTGSSQYGYIINGQTYKDEAGTQRISNGSIVTTADGKSYKMGADGQGHDYVGTLDALGLSDMGGYGGGTDTSNDMIAEMYRQRNDAAIADLKSVYDQNVNTLNTTKAQIPDTFNDARNKTAGTAAVERANFGEYAAASGLNSGAGGQANLAFSTSLQGNLNALNTEQARQIAQIDLQLANLKTDYQSAVNKLIAQGKFEEAQAMYDNWKTRSAQMQEQQRYIQQMAIEKQRYDTELSMSQDSTAYNRALQKYQATGDITVMAPWWGNVSNPTQSTGATTNSERMTGYTNVDTYTPGAIDTNNIDTQNVLSLGYGPLSYEQLEQMVEDGRLIAEKDANGRVTFRKVQQQQLGILDLIR